MNYWIYDIETYRYEWVIVFKDAVDMYAEGMTTAEAVKIFGDYYETGRPEKSDFMKTVEKFS